MTVPNYLGVHRLIKGSTMTPTFTRGPGEALGVFTLETAMDELANLLQVDPVELRLRNHTPVDPVGHPWRTSGRSVAAPSADHACQLPRTNGQVTGCVRCFGHPQGRPPHTALDTHR